MGNERKTPQSREEALEKILAETADGKYRMQATAAQARIKAARAAKEEKASAKEKARTSENTAQDAPYMTEAQKAEAAKARAAEKLALAKRQKELEQKLREEEMIREAQARRAAAEEQRKQLERSAEPKEETQSGEDTQTFDETAGQSDEKAPLRENTEETAESGESVSESLEEPEPYFDEAVNEPEKSEKGIGIWGDILDIAECVAAAAFTVLLVFTFLLHVACVQGTSMVPTLEEGDRLMLSGIGYSPKRGDIVVLEGQTAALLTDSGNIIERDGVGKSIVKRIIATGGQTIDFDFTMGKVIVDGKVIDEPYISEVTHRDEFAFKYPLEIPEGYVFVLGDNRNVSKDSRHPDVGLVPEEEIVGKVLFRIYPFGKFGGLD